jgi:hypothetical protein
MVFSRRKAAVSTLSRIQILQQDSDSHRLFEYLQELFVELKQLFETVEVWFNQEIVMGGGLAQSVAAINCLARMVRAFYPVYNAAELRKYVGFNEKRLFNFQTSKYPDISFERQNLIRSVGFHFEVIEFLEENMFLFESLGKLANETQRKVGKLVFFHCF